MALPSKSPLTMEHAVYCVVSFFFQAEDGIRYLTVTGVQTCALPISFAVLFRVGNVLRDSHPQFVAEAGFTLLFACEIALCPFGCCRRHSGDCGNVFRADRKSVV